MLRRRQIPAKAAPGVGQQPVFGAQRARSHRIEMHVITRRLQVAVAATLDQQGFVASAKNVAEELLAMIQADGVGAQKPAHAGHPIRVGRLQHQMKMVAHQAIGMDLPFGLLAGLSQGLEKVQAVHIINENILPAVTTVHHMVDRARIFHSHGARHELRPVRLPPNVNHQNNPSQKLRRCESTV